MPLFVITDDSMQQWHENVVDALAWWNENQCNVRFTEDISLAGTGVVVVLPYWEVNGNLGSTSKHEQTATIRLVPDPANPRAPQRVIRHELGHVTGLPHNEDSRSVMYEAALPGRYELALTDKLTLEDIYGECSW